MRDFRLAYALRIPCAAVCLSIAKVSVPPAHPLVDTILEGFDLCVDRISGQSLFEDLHDDGSAGDCAAGELKLYVEAR